MKKWLVLMERLVEIATVMCKFPWMVEVVRQKTYGDKTREIYRPKGLLAYTTAAREYMRIL